MADNGSSPKVLVDSAASTPTPKWMIAAGITLGALMLWRAIPSFYADGFGREAATNFLLGVICVFGSGISRRMYLADIGIVRETRSWGRVIRRVAPWDDVKYVTLAFRGDRMMAFFEIDVKGWKVPFAKNQERAVRDVLDEMLPGDVTVKVAEHS
jgi:hypothetical protein